MEVKKVMAPVRIDFGGGTTDVEPFPTKYGGAVLNAAIDHHVVGELESSSKGISLSYSENIPTSSGLGTSSVMNLVWLSLISQKRFKDDRDKMALAEEVYRLEQAMGLVGGKQDEYAGAVGGINFMEFRKGNKVIVQKLKLKPSLIKELESHLILVYTGKPHSSNAVKDRRSIRIRLFRNKGRICRQHGYTFARIVGFQYLWARSP